MVIVESNKVDGVPERKRFGRMKLLQFSENHRPAYWGTWNKKTAVIRPRNPWAQDKVSLGIGVPHGGGLLYDMFHHGAHALFSLQNLLDYEVDSDDEWEEEEPGESLSHSEGVSNPSGDEWHQLHQLQEPAVIQLAYVVGPVDLVVLVLLRLLSAHHSSFPRHIDRLL